MALLEVENIAKNFDNNEVLKNISFTLEKGEVLSIIGSSGSGKTTLLRCLNFLESADCGRISVGGTTVFDADSKKKLTQQEKSERQLRFGLVFQQFNLFPQYSVLKNVTLAPMLMKTASLKAKKASKKERHSAFEEIEANARELLESVGLGEKLDFYPSQLSGGQQQRVAIARALALKPDILCFDEPTSALDPELTGEVLKVIKGLKGKDRTMIVVTHEMEFAREVSDKVIFMTNGVIEEQGTPEEVFGSPKSEKMKSFLRKLAD
ncbi:MAG: amino acid ABC transporter ATP-binding protein [Eubacteriales bacterium]